MAATDYGRWEELEANLRAEEDQARLQKEEASKKTRSMMGGCSRDHTQERQLFEKSTPEKLEAAERFRLEGNEAFKDSNWGLAAVNYRRALLQFDYTFPDTEEDIAKAAALQLRCILNLAAAKLKQEDYKEVLHQCKQALDIDSSCVKALYRRGVAFSAMENFDEAEEALKAAYAAEPTNADVIREIKIVRLKRQQYRRKSQRIAQAAVASTSPSRGSPQDASQGAPPQVAGKLEEEERRSEAAENSPARPENSQTTTFANVPVASSSTSTPQAETCAMTSSCSSSACPVSHPLSELSCSSSSFVLSASSPVSSSSSSTSPVDPLCCLPAVAASGSSFLPRVCAASLPGSGAVCASNSSVLSACVPSFALSCPSGLLGAAQVCSLIRLVEKGVDAAGVPSSEPLSDRLEGANNPVPPASTAPCGAPGRVLPANGAPSPVTAAACASINVGAPLKAGLLLFVFCLCSHLCCLLLGAVLAISARTPTTFFVTLAAATAAVLAASIVIHRSAAALNFTSTYTNPDAPSAPCPPPPTQSTYSVRDSFTSCASDAVNARTAAGTVRRRIAAASL
eukprot:GHVT01033718.1.p1 GENE.GHVT01033718.1~~GHVT01033718.1.p1  ORF type:complete len:569 (+),score=128.56 GHVT01033718.1:380-2086(+)